MKKSLAQIKSQLAEKTIPATTAKELQGGYYWRVRSTNSGITSKSTLSIGVDCFGVCGDAD